MRKQRAIIAPLCVAAALAGGLGWLQWRYTHATVWVVNATAGDVTFVQVTFRTGQYVETHTLIKLGVGQQSPVHFAPPDSGSVTLSYQCDGERIDPGLEAVVGPRGEQARLILEPRTPDLPRD